MILFPSYTKCTTDEFKVLFLCFIIDSAGEHVFYLGIFFSIWKKKKISPINYTDVTVNVYEGILFR